MKTKIFKVWSHNSNVMYLVRAQDLYIAKDQAKKLVNDITLTWYVSEIVKKNAIKRKGA